MLHTMTVPKYKLVYFFLHFLVQSKTPKFEITQFEAEFKSEVGEIRFLLFKTITFPNFSFKNDKLGCHHCSLKFKQRKCFQKHLQSIHKAGILASYTCPTCSFTTSNSDEFISHLEEEQQNTDEHTENSGIVDENLQIKIKQEPEVDIPEDVDEPYQFKEISPFSIKVEPT